MPKDISKGAGFLVISMMAANFEFSFQCFLGRVLGFEELGLIVLVNTLWMVASIFIGAVSSTVNHRTAILAASGNSQEARFLNSVLNKSTAIATLFTVLIAALGQQLSVFSTFKIR